MLHSELEDRIREVMAGVLEVEPGVIGSTFARADAPLWDSLNHLRLVTALEEAFGIRFSMQEVSRLECFASIHQAVSCRL